MKRGSILFASLMVGSIAYGKNQPATAHADLINSQGEKIGTAKLTQSRKGVEIVIDAPSFRPGCMVSIFTRQENAILPISKQRRDTSIPKERSTVSKIRTDRTRATCRT